MSNKKLGLVLFIIAIILIAVFGVYKITTGVDDSKTDQSSSVSNGSSNEPKESSDVKLTADVVKKHSSKDDCWTIIEGQVYDITDYVSGHPGGQEILRACGGDATTLFTKRETAEGEEVGSGTPHSSNAQKQLSKFLIGPIEN